MDDAPIVCAKCGAASQGGLVCALCGGALVKVCPSCTFKNSISKKYCDRCGHEFAKGATRPPVPNPDQPAAPPPAQPLPPPSGPGTPPRPDAVIPQTVIFKKAPPAGTPREPPKADAGSLPQAGRSQNVFAAPRAPDSLKKQKEADKRPSKWKENLLEWVSDLLARAAYIVKSALAIVFLLALGLVGLIFYRQYRAINSPQSITKALAARYLELLRGGDYGNAYFMLSSAAKAATSLDDFRLARDTTSWTWSNLTPLKVAPGAALLGYDIDIEGRGRHREYLWFVQENEQWVRPYNWTQLRNADAALSHNDPDMAVFQAQEAVNINPFDPLARAYLCEADYFRRLPPETDRECGTALDLASQYPSKVEGPALLHVYAILADNLRGGLSKPADAAQVYTRALALPGLTEGDRCDLLKARGESWAAAGRTAEAQADAQASSRPCGQTRRARAQLPSR